jgi:DNA-binding CsgD family transcriptional regulator
MKEALVADAIAGFQAAAIDALPWATAVERLAAATGSRSGELIGLGADCLVPFNIMTGADPVAGPEFLAAGGGDPAINSRVRVGSRSAELEIKDEADFTTAADMRLNPEYGDWVTGHDMAHVCLTTLVKEEHHLVGMAIMRGAQAEPIDRETKRAFAAIAPHARRAVRTSMALEREQLAGVITGLAAVRATAFVCSAEGRLRGMTPSAEAMVAEARFLTVKNGRLSAAAMSCTADLQQMLADAAIGGAGAMRPLALRSRCGEDVRLAEASIIPSSHALSSGSSALLIIHEPSADERRVAAAAQLCFGLSLAEAEIAAQLALGHTAIAIAAGRQVSVGTVRSQVRSIFAKMRVTSQVEIAARLAGFR